MISSSGEPSSGASLTNDSDRKPLLRVSPVLAAGLQSTWFRGQADASQEIFRDRESGSLFGVVCNANRVEDGAVLVVYRNLETGARLVATVESFNDGRFERVT